MDTTTAARQAGVTVATIRAWCRIGAVAATKRNGRWTITPASLTRRIEIGEKRMPRYTISETNRERLGRTFTSYAVTRTDGTPAGPLKGQDRRIRDMVFSSREHAELVRDFLNATPDEYRIERGTYPQRNLKAGRKFWLATGGRNGDPMDLRSKWDDDQEVKGTWPEGTRPVDILIHQAVQHAAGAEARIQTDAEKQAVTEAERQVREAREAQLAELGDQKGELATQRQIDYILLLLEKRQISGEGGGFFQGPTDRAGIEELTKAEASAYITSLKDEY